LRWVLVLVTLLVGGPGLLGGWVRPCAAGFLVTVPYAVLYVMALRRRKLPEDELAELVIDGQFYLAAAGVAALVAWA
jgi:hypothetical protein